MKTQQTWPILNFSEMQGTLETLHQWIQIVGKIRLRAMPWQNHSWHAALYISPQGFSTHGIPYKGRIFQIDFNFENHRLLIRCTNEKTVGFDLRPMTVSDFYSKVFQQLEAIGINVKINARPNEMEPAIPFKENTINKIYNPDAANSLWLAMLKANNIFNLFRSEFIGKCSPVHLFWGAFDLAVSRFSGNPAPLHPGGMPNTPLEVMQEAYSHEVSSAGFWPGSAVFPFPVFYSYIYPVNADFENQKVLPDEAFYSKEMGEFLLKYEDVINSPDPEKTLLDFLNSTYLAGAKTSGWERDKLEKK